MLVDLVFIYIFILDFTLQTSYDLNSYQLQIPQDS